MAQMRLLQINVTANWGSTGRIAEGIGVLAQKRGWESYVAYGRLANPSQCKLVQIGKKTDYLEHCIESRIFDNQGLASRTATKLFLEEVERIRPDIIHIHNLVGYFVNYPLLFQYLKTADIPVVWTLHDCWAFTGHCVYFDQCGCDRWKTQCFDCPQKKTYPVSYVFDRSRKNYIEKKQYFTSLDKLHIVSVSNWLDNLVGQSFLQNQHHLMIHNGIDTDVFAPAADRFANRRKLQIADDQIMLLGVASIWSKRKGLNDFIALSKRLDSRYKIVLIGLSEKQKAGLPDNVIGILRTESAKQLAEVYSAADLFMNLTYEENYPTTNLEAISCGTPCLTYLTGGSPESVTENTGFKVKQGDLDGVMACIKSLKPEGKESVSRICREYAEINFRQEDRYLEYISLYEKLICKGAVKK